MTHVWSVSYKASNERIKLVLIHRRWEWLRASDSRLIDVQSVYMKIKKKSTGNKPE